MFGPAAPSEEILAQMKAGAGEAVSTLILSTYIDRYCPQAVIAPEIFRDDHLGPISAQISSFVEEQGGGDLYVSSMPQSRRLIVEGAKSADNRKNVYVQADGIITFAGGWFGKIVFQKGVEVEFRDCCVSHIEASAREPLTRLRIKLANTWLGCLWLRPASILSLDVSGGGILDIDCVPPGEKNPFVGSVSFNRVFLPRKKGVYGMPGAQPYRNLRYHLNALQNAPAASFVHSAEQGMERQDERLLNWLFSYLYELLSDYGASPARPIGWLIALWVCLTLTLFMFDGVEVGTKGMDPVGWQASLIGDDWCNRLLRSVALSVQPLSWLGALSSQGRTVQLVAANIWFQGALIFEGILSAVLLALFAFALRRRFRMAS